VHAAVIATTVTTPETTPFRLFVAGEDIYAGLQSLEWEHAGSNGAAALRANHYDATEAFSLPGHGEVRYWDQANDVDLFGGYLMGRTASPIPSVTTGRMTQLVATDYSIELDRNLVTGISYPAGLSDQAIIQGLCGNFLKGTVSFFAATVAETNTSMPAMVFDMQSLRSALEQVATAANGDGLGERQVWVDASRRLRYRRTSATSAPYTITDGAESGSDKQPETMDLVNDDSAIITAVYIIGANAAGSGWVVNGANVQRYGWRGDTLNVPDSDTAAKRDAYGQSYLQLRSAPVRRGTFTITATDGWAADQNVTITNGTLGLSAESFLIKHVTVRVLPTATALVHTIEFGARKPGRAAPVGRGGSARGGGSLR
jgi:hypothetical protein